MIETIEDIKALAKNPKKGRVPGDNSYNVSWAAAALNAYIEVIGGDLENAVEDLLGDLMHLVDVMSEELDQDFDCALDTARTNYEAEVSGE